MFNGFFGSLTVAQDELKRSDTEHVFSIKYRFISVSNKGLFFENYNGEHTNT